MKLNEAINISEKILIESSVARTKDYLKNYNCATISAFRPHEKLSNKKALALNKEKSSDLGKALNKLGYTHFLVDGAWIKRDNDGNIIYKNNEMAFGNEITYFVVNNNGDSLEKFKTNIKKLGEDFDQDSVMFYGKGTNLAFWNGTTHRKDAPLKFGDNLLLKNGKWEPKEFRTTLRGRHNTGFTYEPTNIVVKNKKGV